MKVKQAERKRMKSQRTALVRASISFPPALYETLEDIARQKKVSLAWVVRDAAEKYVPVEAGKGGNEHIRGGHGTGKLTRRSA
jgi:metal-responsive CopG/Arc/MetJ family transcriptional regulator